MNLEQRTAGVERGVALPLSALTYLVRKHDTITFVAEHRLRENHVKLGRIDYGPGGAKLQAIHSLHVLPGHNLSPSAAIEPRGVKYQLEPASSDRVEIIFLRHGDIITSPDATGSLACVGRTPEVQVNSSTTEKAQDETPEKADGVEDTPEDETEDEAAPDGTITEVPVTQTVTQPSKSQPSATPHLPRDRSLVVHETPTTSRMVETNNYEVEIPSETHHVAPASQDTTAVIETYSTARTDHSPTNVVHKYTGTEIAVERKRSRGSPEVRVNGRRGRKNSSIEPSPHSDVELPIEGRSAKRARNGTSTSDDSGNIHHASPFNDINTNLSRTTYSTKRNNRSKPISDATPILPSTSSPHSGTATAAAAYEGDPPRVATSNSAIKEGSPTVKFLRRHGGTLLSTVDDKCNVLCVRDGGLVKTMKVFQAIALGIPIVTDKWLSDSAKADGFLDLSSYKPSVAQQEKDWNFSLEKVWGTAQTPFQNYCIYFTPALRKTYTSFQEMERVCQTVGAEVMTKPASKNKTTIVLAAEADDPDAERMIEDGEVCYYKDLVTMSILRGKLELDGDEFRIKAKHAAPARRKTHRKST